jgi:hypothetical protein
MYCDIKENASGARVARLIGVDLCDRSGSVQIVERLCEYEELVDFTGELPKATTYRQRSANWVI